METNVVFDGQETMTGEIVVPDTVTNEDLMGVIVDSSDEMSTLAKVIAALAGLGAIGGMVAGGFGIKKLFDFCKEKAGGKKSKKKSKKNKDKDGKKKKSEKAKKEKKDDEESDEE